MENSDYMFKIRVIKDQFMGLNDNAELVAVTKSPAQSWIFQIIRNKDNIDQIKIKASSNGKLLQVMPDGSVKANGESGGSWSNSDPTIFTIHIDKNKQMDGDRQLCSFYGAEQAIKILQVFAWWITRDNGPPSCHPPNYPGYQAVLDRAFDWADKYNLRVIIDLHAAPGSQNGQAHGGSRDGTVRWGDAKINETVQVIKALADRYASRKSLLAIELLNEPWAPQVGLDTLKKYYRAGYISVKERVHNPDVYVIMSNRLNTRDPTELVDFASTFHHCVIDVHYYNLYDSSSSFNTVEKNINFVKTTRASQLKSLMRANGARVFVGEWTTEWKVENTKDEDRKRFADVQMDIYGQASFGWAYWTYKNHYASWSMKDLIENGIISVPQN
ncbi:hypothetical protein GUJ93_ZPchr0012g20680 [Zizania palustris]|uniref:Mannan endo-1,4-beta-mannosidase n=1 Tax=Zizania palustris TaxID=103762 RepID=A0A8J6BUU8_ZIZPA|nr:hypothetical protein GUJ93_ZPchr0012g20680 [Zizania palustris]